MRQVVAFGIVPEILASIMACKFVPEPENEMRQALTTLPSNCYKYLRLPSVGATDFKI